MIYALARRPARARAQACTFPFGVALGGLARVLALLISVPCALAQWSSDSAVNLTVAGRGSEQVQPKIRATSDGGAYISWFDNFAGGYDVYLQKLDAQGNLLWAAPGLLIADRAVSSTQDYELAVAPDGDAVIAFGSDGGVSGVALQVAVQRVSPAGTIRWANGGVVVSTGAEIKSLPRLAVMADGTAAIGWSYSPMGLRSRTAIMRVSITGALLGSPVEEVNASNFNLTLSDIQPGSASAGDASFIALCVVQNGTTVSAARHLYAQKYNAAGVRQWGTAGALLPIFTTTSIQLGYFPTFLPDGAGGAIFTWYENGGSRNAYLMHVNANGTIRFGSALATTGATPGFIRISAAGAYDPVSAAYYVASTESSSPTQNQWRGVVQKFDNLGNRAWGDGVGVTPLTGNQTSFVNCAVVGDGAVVAGFVTTGPTNGNVFAARVRGNQQLAWSNLPGTNVSAKARLSIAAGARGNTLLAWTDGVSGTGDVRAHNLNADGTFAPAQLGLADIAGPGLSEGSDGELTADDIILFISRFTSGDWRADVASPGQLRLPDGEFTADDVIVFIGAFSNG